MSHFRPFLWFIALTLVFVFVPAAAIPVGAAACTSCAAVLSPEEQTLWQQIADARANTGLSPISIDAASVSLARARSADMAQHHLFGHVSSTGVTFLNMMSDYVPNWQFASETIQRNNYADPPREAARSMIASLEHHAILFDTIYRIGGVGTAVSDDGIHYFTIIVIQP